MTGYQTDDELAFSRQAGLRLKELRLWRGISQMALAAEVGITFQQLQKYEKGDNRISLPRLNSICRALGITLGAFVDPLDTGGNPAAGFSARALRLASAFDNIAAKPQLQEAVLRLAVALEDSEAAS